MSTREREGCGISPPEGSESPRALLVVYLRIYGSLGGSGDSALFNSFLTRLALGVRAESEVYTCRYIFHFLPTFVRDFYGKLSLFPS
jgi:hypothetical protein